jgi:hypothetical protein
MLCCHYFSTVIYVEDAIMRVQVSQNDLKLNCTHQLLVYAADVKILG